MSEREREKRERGEEREWETHRKEERIVVYARASALAFTWTLQGIPVVFRPSKVQFEKILLLFQKVTVVINIFSKLFVLYLSYY